MEQNTPQQIANTQVSNASANTFSAEVARENTVSTDAFENNQSVLAAHRRGLVFRGMWVILILLLLAALVFAVYITVRGRGGIGKVLTAADNYNPTSLNVTGATTAPLNGQLTVNGDQLNNGDLTVLGTINGVGDLNIGGNANIGGTLTATNLVGSLQASSITGTIAQNQLNPFVAYTNKDFQLFFGTNQTFRNATNSVGAFEIQTASSAPVLSVNTTNEFVGIGNSSPNFNLDVTGNGRFSGQLLVGPNSTANGTILNTGSLFSGREIHRTLTTQEILTQNTTNKGIYAGLANELLVNPVLDPYTNDNFFTGSYSALETTGAFNYTLNGGGLSSYTHNGSGTVGVGVGQYSTVGNFGTGTILFATGNLTAPTMTGGNILNYSGFSAVDPNGPLLAYLGLPPLITGGTLQQQFGVYVQEQHSGVTNVNIYSEGPTTNNYFEGKVNVGVCGPGPISALFGCTAATGNKLLVNNTGTADANAVIRVSAQAATDKPLVVVAHSAQTANLTEWQNSGGTALSAIDANGNLGLGTSTPSNRLSVVNTSDDTPAEFTGTSGTCTVDTLGGSLSCVSDEKLKTNILTIDGGLDKIMQLRGVTYNWKANPDTAAVSGFIAQEVEKVLPGLVSQLPDGTRSLNKDGIIPYLVGAIQDQQNQIDALKNGSQISGGMLSGGIVANDIEFQGKATFDALVTHSGNVVFAGDATFNGTITGSSNNRGRTTVAAGATAVSVPIGAGHSGLPNVQLTPLSQIDGGYWVSGSLVSGFTIQLEKPQSSSTQFNWLVID